jgi:hypothetical protein
MSPHAVQFMTHPITRIVRLFGYYYWLSLPLQSKYVNEMDVAGLLTILLPSDPPSYSQCRI